MTATPPPIGPNLHQWARATRSYLQRWVSNIPWKRQDANPSENGLFLWDETLLAPVVSHTGAFHQILQLRDIPTNRLVVKDASQLAGALDSNTLYLVDGAIDMGTQSITVPQGGLHIRGLATGISSLFSTSPNFTLFIDDGVFSGDLFIDQLDLDISGPGSKVWDLDNAGNLNAIECVAVNFLNCTELGTLHRYRQGLWSNVSLIGCVDGVTCSGVWAGGFASLTSIIVGGAVPTFTGTLFKAGPGLVMNGSFRSDMNALGLNDAGAFSDFAPANIANNGEFYMNGVRVNKAANAFPNMPPSDLKARFSNCVGTTNTYVGAQWSVASEAVTVIPAANTPVKIAGTTTYTDVQWFSGAVDNATKYEGDDQIGVIMHGTLTFTGKNGDQINLIFRHWDESAGAYVVPDLAETGPFTLNASGRAEGATLHAFCDFDTGDRLEAWVENQSSSQNVTCKIGGIVSINERPS